MTLEQTFRALFPNDQVSLSKLTDVDGPAWGLVISRRDPETGDYYAAVGLDDPDAVAADPAAVAEYQRKFNYALDKYARDRS